MLVLKPTDLLKASDKSIPEAIAGRIVDVAKRHSGTGNYGPYSMQRITIADNANKIVVVVKDRDEIPMSAKGTDFYANCVQGKRGLSGLKRLDDKYKGNTTPQVWAYSDAEITINGGSAAADQQQAPAQNQQRSQGQQRNTSNDRQSQPPAQSVPPKAGEPGVPLALTKSIFRTSAVYGRCIDAAFALAEAADKRHSKAGGFKPSSETIQSIAASIWITVSREHSIPGNTAIPTSYDKFVEMATPPARAANPPPVDNQAPFHT